MIEEKPIQQVFGKNKQFGSERTKTFFGSASAPFMARTRCWPWLRWFFYHPRSRPSDGMMGVGATGDTSCVCLRGDPLVHAVGVHIDS